MNRIILILSLLALPSAKAAIVYCATAVTEQSPLELPSGAGGNTRIVELSTALNGAGSFSVAVSQAGQLFQIQDGVERIASRWHPFGRLQSLGELRLGPIKKVTSISTEASAYSTAGMVAGIEASGRIFSSSADLGASVRFYSPPTEITDLALANLPDGASRLFLMDRHGVVVSDRGLAGKSSAETIPERLISWEQTLSREVGGFDFLTALDANSLLVASETGHVAQVESGEITRSWKLPLWITSCSAYRIGDELVLWLIAGDGGLYRFSSQNEALTLVANAESFSSPLRSVAAAASETNDVFNDSWKEGFLSLAEAGKRERVLVLHQNGTISSPWQVNRPGVVNFDRIDWFRSEISQEPQQSFALHELIRFAQKSGLAFDGPGEFGRREAKLRNFSQPTQMTLLLAWSQRRKHERFLELAPEIGKFLTPLPSLSSQLLLLDILDKKNARNLLRMEQLEEPYFVSDLAQTRDRLMMPTDRVLSGEEWVVLKPIAYREGVTPEQFLADFGAWNLRHQSSRPLHENLAAYLKTVNPIWYW